MRMQTDTCAPRRVRCIHLDMFSSRLRIRATSGKMERRKQRKGKEKKEPCLDRQKISCFDLSCVVALILSHEGVPAFSIATFVPSRGPSHAFCMVIIEAWGQLGKSLGLDIPKVPKYQTRWVGWSS